MSDAEHVVDVGLDFTRFPAGRTKTDGPFSGEAFRDKFLRPWLDRREPIVVKLDTALGYGSSFLEEAFGGLVRLNYSADEILRLIRLETKDPFLKAEIQGYIESARP